MLAIDHDDEGGFLAVEELLDHHARACVTESIAGQHVTHGFLGFLEGHGNDHALAGGQAVGLDHDRGTLLAQVGQRRFDFGEVLIVGGRDGVTRQEVLGERLGAFQLRGGGGGAEDVQAARAEQVDDAFDQWCLGADDGQLHIGSGEIGQLLDGQYVDGDVLALGFGGGAGVARGDEHLGNSRILRDLPGQGMLAAAAADDQYVHFSLPMEAGR